MLRQEPALRSPGTAPWWLRVLLPLVVAGAAFVTFLPALDAGFVNWDDDVLLLENHRWRGLGHPQLEWMFTSGTLGHYHPLTWLSYALDYRLWGGLDPRGFHLTSVVFHALNAVLFYVLALRLLRLAKPGRDRGRADQVARHVGAALAALLFAVHPLRVESVVWVTERRDVLSVFFLIPCLLCYLRYATARRWAARWYVASLVLLLLSLLSKAWGITVPAVLLVLDCYPLGRLRWGWRRLVSGSARRAYLDKIPFALLAAWAALVAAKAQAYGEVMKPLDVYGLPERIAQSFYGLAFYIVKTLMPSGLLPIYELPVHMSPFEARFVAAAAGVVVLTAVLIALARRWPAGLALWACYCFALSPVLGIVQSGPQLVADRYSYISCMTWALLAGAVLTSCLKPRVDGRVRHKVAVSAGMVGAVVLVVLAGLTWGQTQVWRTSRTLWEHTLAVNPDSWTAQHNLGAVCRSEDDLDGALQHYRAALALKDDVAEAWCNIGLILAGQGNAAEAAKHMRQARTLAADNTTVLRQVAGVLLRLGHTREALDVYEELVTLVPEDPLVHMGLAGCFRRMGQLPRAIPHLEKAVELIEHFGPPGPGSAGGGQLRDAYIRACTDLIAYFNSRGSYARSKHYANKLRMTAPRPQSRPQ